VESGDEPSIKALVTTFYGAFDNRGSRIPSGDALSAIFASHATITRLVSGGVEIMDYTAFVEPRIALLRSGDLSDFHEWETEGETIVLGNIASHWSVYRKEGRLNGAPYVGGGRKLLHLCRPGRSWLISALLWEDD
jgi:hypothetical protein